jgi:hypothetical protein
MPLYWQRQGIGDWKLGIYGEKCDMHPKSPLAAKNTLLGHLIFAMIIQVDNPYLKRGKLA